MRWPWTSVARLDDLRSERDYLRERVVQLEDRLTRIQRRKAGLPETPRPERPALEQMPYELREYIQGFASGVIRKDMRDRAFKRHAQGEPWSSIVEDLMKDAEPFDVVTIGGETDEQGT